MHEGESTHDNDCKSEIVIGTSGIEAEIKKFKQDTTKSSNNEKKSIVLKSDTVTKALMVSKKADA